MKGNSLEINRTGLEIAVIGMSCEFPGAKTIAEFWENLKNGVESISFFTDQELEAEGASSDIIADPHLIKSRGIIKDNEYFDSSFFGFRPMEAELMDPQFRVFYECTWQALENAGYDPDTYEGLIGLYAGASNNRGWEMLAFFSPKGKSMGGFALDHLIDRDFLSTRVAHRLNLRGPAITLKTACSTALVAVDLACRGLLTGQCDLGLAGGISVISNSPPAYIYREGLIRSPDGHVRAFDASSKGVIFSDGGGVVVLKRLTDAMADRDTIYAVVKGTAVNNDGSRKGTYESPCIEGQADVIEAAIHVADVEPESITYVETHGTGTVVGDPIEIGGLSKAFSTDKTGYCAIGSVKSNFGHLDTAAGIAGFIKTVLVLSNRMIPPSLHFEEPNSKIDFTNTPFYVNAGLQEWKNDRYPLRAGVSSFGVGGTNAHAILEEAPEPEETTASREYQMIFLSARSDSALEQASDNLMEYIKQHPEVDLADVAYTLHVGRKAFKHRKMWVIDVKSPDFDTFFNATARDNNQVVFMFPGQGAQYENMGLELYRKEPIFREEMDRCFGILEKLLDFNIKDILYPGTGEGSVDTEISGKYDINQTQITQPVLFMIEYALGQLLLTWGIKPYAMIGHSIGEYAAACLAGVFSLEDALTLVVNRGKLMQQMPSGAMLSVTLPEQELMPMLAGHTGLALAAVNAPSLCVVSGPHEVVEAFANQLEENGIENRQLHTSHAFHSSMMDPILEQFSEVVKKVTLSRPQLPYISNVTGTWITVEQALDPGYWTTHLRQAVRFGDGLTPLMEEPDTILLEVGPGRSLSTFARKHKDKKPGHKIINFVKHPREVLPDQQYLLNNIGQLWLYGQGIDWAEYYSEEKRRRIPLPTYPFENQRYWLERQVNEASLTGIQRQVVLGKRPEIGDWLYVPSWKRSPQPKVPVAGAGENQEPLHWLVFTAEQGLSPLGKGLLEQLQRPGIPGGAGDIFTLVIMGNAFSGAGTGTYTIDPGQADQYRELVADLKKQERIPQRVLHLWNLTPDEGDSSGLLWDEAIASRTFYSLIYLAQALGDNNIDAKIEITVVTDNMQAVNGEEELHPEKAAVLGPLMVIPREYSNLSCRSVDVAVPGPGTQEENDLIERLVREVRTAVADTANVESVAYRGSYRWVKTIEPMPLANPGIMPGCLKQGGTYLITGGLGGIGLVLARHLAETVQAKLILISRSSLPGPEDWDAWLSTHPAHEAISSKILKIRELEGLGAQVMVFGADISNPDRMRTVLDSVNQEWGDINGVIHAAGLPGGGLIQLKTPEMADQVLRPKVKGIQVLDALFQDQPLDFFMLCSSINSIVPLLGQVDYYAANAFLDAYAYYKTRRDRVFTVSINWDTWQEVGMAVAAARQLTGAGQQRESQYLEVEHPLLDHYMQTNNKEEIFITRFQLDRHWVLNEHKVAESGKGLVPGVTYLEMAREAFTRYLHRPGENRDGNGGAGVEISEVYFLNPLMVAEGEERETWLILSQPPEGSEMQGYDFLVQSREKANPGQWQTHAVGKICRIKEEKEAVTHDLDRLKTKFEKAVYSIDGRKWRAEHGDGNRQQGLLIFGPRWKSHGKIQYSGDEGLAFLELNEAFSSDLDVYGLHPALLDIAAGFLYENASKGGAYIPFGYKKLTMKGRLPGTFYSYSRLTEGSETEKEFLKFDITIIDEQGVERVDIKEFSMMHVSENVKGKIKEKEAAVSQPEAAASAVFSTPEEETGESSRETEFLKNGILPAEGIDVFNRVLWAGQPQVIVSTLDLLTRQKQGGTAAALPRQAAEPVKSQGPMHQRPELSTVYTAPENDTQQLIVNIWQEILGIDRIGIHDDFFALGGDSLSIVQVNNKLKKAVAKDIPVAMMFRYLTVESLAGYLLEQENAGAPAPEEKIDRTEELVKGRSRLQARMSRKMENPEEEK